MQDIEIDNYIRENARLVINFLSAEALQIDEKQNNLSNVMRKPVFAICEQQRRRSACASANSDQHLCFRCLNSIISQVSISKISSLHLTYGAEQAGLRLPW